MPQDTFQLAAGAAAVYEDQKVPAIFEPLAEATLDKNTLDSSDVILDVACGTGIVARKARQRLGPSPRIVGVDLNEGMIAAARNSADEAPRSCEWYVADVTKLPFGAETFSIAFCQQGVQFFPNELAAFKEVGRVLRPRGRLVLSVWNGPSDLFKALATALDRHVGADIGLRSLSPFLYGQAAAIGSVLSDQGFTDISEHVISLNRVIADPETALPKEIMASPVGPVVAEGGEAIMRTIVTDTVAALTTYRRGTGFVVPQHTRLIEAKDPLMATKRSSAGRWIGSAKGP